VFLYFLTDLFRILLCCFSLVDYGGWLHSFFHASGGFICVFWCKIWQSSDSQKSLITGMEEVEEVLGRNRLEDVSWLCSLSESELVSIWSKLPTQLFLFCI
jgi:hypothetical protein